VKKPDLLNNVFRSVQELYRQKPMNLTHTEKVGCFIGIMCSRLVPMLIRFHFQVMRLYRQSLKQLMSWTVYRDVFNEEAIELRARFEANRNLDAQQGTVALEKGEQELFDESHVDPYCNPYMPGGSSFMRNPPLPIDICFPDGKYPADAPLYVLNADMTQVKKETGKAAVGSVLIDFNTKSMY